MIGGWELIVILLVVLILFGGKKLPEFARNLGKGMHEFKKASQGFTADDDLSAVAAEPVQKTATTTVEAEISSVVPVEGNDP